MYFVKENSLLRRLDIVDIKNVPWFENEEANDLAQIASGYRASKEKLEDLTEVKDKLILTSAFFPWLLKSKLAKV